MVEKVSNGTSSNTHELVDLRGTFAILANSVRTTLVQSLIRFRLASQSERIQSWKECSCRGGSVCACMHHHYKQRSWVENGRCEMNRRFLDGALLAPAAALALDECTATGQGPSVVGSKASPRRRWPRGTSCGFLQRAPD